MSYRETFVDSTGDSRLLELRFHRESRMRYCAKDVETLFADNYDLLKMILEHHQLRQRPRLQELLDYAEGNNHEVLKAGRRREKDMADSRAVHNFGKAIASFKQGYLVGVPVRVEYDSDNENNGTQEVLDDIARQNNFHQLNRSLVLDLSKTGRAYDLVYRAQDDTTRAVKLDVLETFVIYDTTLEAHSVAGVRYYNVSQFDSKVKHVEVYTDKEIITFDWQGDLQELDRQPHSFGLVPITEYLNTSEGIGDYETVLSLIDLYDSAQSDTANYMQDLSDAILMLIGDFQFPAGIEKDGKKRLEYMQKMRKARLMHLKPATSADGSEKTASGQYLYKQYDVNGTEAYKNRIVNDIHKFTNVPDMTDENFSGVQSGEAMKWKVFGLDQERVDMQALFEQSLKRRYRLVAAIGGILKEIKDFDISKLSITFTPNLPANVTDVINNAKTLYGVVSDETTFNMLEQATGVSADVEMERLDKEAESRASEMMIEPRLGDEVLDEQDEEQEPSGVLAEEG